MQKELVVSSLGLHHSSRSSESQVSLLIIEDQIRQMQYCDDLQLGLEFWKTNEVNLKWRLNLHSDHMLFL